MPAQPTDQPTADPFPMDRFTALVKRLPSYARLGWRLGNDRTLSGGRRAAVFGAAAYLASPIDLVPGIIPVAGQLDDAAVALLGLRFALRGLPQEARQAHLSATGLAIETIDHDLKTVRLGAAWILRRGGRIGLRVGRGLFRMAARGTGMALRRLR